MGGGWGDVCISIADALFHTDQPPDPFPNFVVKDLDRMIINGLGHVEESNLAGSIKKNITFKKYNFIDDGDNDKDDADIYMFRFVMHDWSDSRVITILKHIVPNMKSTARILIMDYIIPTQHVFPLVVERLKRFVNAHILATMIVTLTFASRTMDIAAMSILAGKERTEDDWGQLITRFNKENPDTSLGFRLCPHNEFRTDNKPYTDSEACTDLKPCTNNGLCNRKRAFGVVELKLASSSSSDAC